MSTIAPPDLPRANDRAETLRAPLLTELRSARPTRRPRVVLAIPVAVAVLISAIAIGTGRETPPALAVEREDGWLVLHIADVTAGEAALTHKLREAGIRGEVRLLPVSDDEVGTWAVIAEWAEPPPPPGSEPDPNRGASGRQNVVRLDRVRNEGKTLRIPLVEVRESTGYFIFYAGRQPRPGEELNRDGDLRWPSEAPPG